VGLLLIQIVPPLFMIFFLCTESQTGRSKFFKSVGITRLPKRFFSLYGELSHGQKTMRQRGGMVGKLITIN